MARKRTILDTGNTYSWSTYVENYDEWGRVDSRAIVYDDGRVKLTDFDQRGDYNFSEISNVFDSLGILDYQSNILDDGRNVITDYQNELFDAAAYLDVYADVRAAGMNPWEHYANHGWKEGRDPSASFDTTAYLAAYQDVAAAGVNPFEHYLTHGSFEGRSSFGDGILDI